MASLLPLVTPNVDIEATLLATPGGGGFAPPDPPTPTHLVIPSDTTSFVSTPDAPELHLPTGIEVRVYCALDDWGVTGQQQIFAHEQAADNRSWVLYAVSNTIAARLSSDGTGFSSAVAPSQLNFPNGSIHGVGFRFTPGFVQFILSEDGDVWTNLGDPVSTPIMSLADTTEVLGLGNRGSGGANVAAGRYFKAEIRDTSDDSVVAAPDFTASEPEETSVTDPQGHVWQLQGNAEIVLH